MIVKATITLLLGVNVASFSVVPYARVGFGRTNEVHAFQVLSSTDGESETTLESAEEVVEVAAEQGVVELGTDPETSEETVAADVDQDGEAESGKTKKATERHTLYVGNIPYCKSREWTSAHNRCFRHSDLFCFVAATVEEIRNLFADHVQVRYVSLPKNTQTGTIKGFAFVDVETEEMIPIAVDNLNGVTMDERKLRVSRSLPKNQIRSRREESKLESAV